MTHLDKKGGNLFKNRKIQLVLLAECLLIAFFVLRLSGHDKVVEILGKDLQCSVAEYDDEVGGYFIDETSEYSGVFTTITGISLQRGTYSVSIIYKTDTNEQNGYTITDPDGNPGALLSNALNFYKGIEKSKNVIWLLEDSDTLEINTTFSGTGYLIVEGLYIYENNKLSYIELFLILCIFLLIDLYLFPFLLRGKKGYHP